MKTGRLASSFGHVGRKMVRLPGRVAGNNRGVWGVVEWFGLAGIGALVVLVAFPRHALATNQVPFFATLSEDVTARALCPPTQTRYLCIDAVGAGHATHLGATGESFTIRVDTSTGYPPVSGFACSTEVRTSILTAANGDQITLSGPGTVCGTPTQATADDSWTVVSGTGRFAGATGSGTDHVSIDRLTHPITAVTTFTGTISSVGSISSLTTFSHGVSAAGSITTVATFHSDQVPENLIFDHQGNIYINMATSGEILKIAPDGTQSTLARLSIGPNGVLLGLEVDAQNNIYANLDSHNAPGTDAQGVWQIHPNGTKELFAATDPAGNLNQGVFDAQGDLLVPDSILGLIYRITPGGQVSTWLSDPLLQPDQAACGGYPHPGGVNDLALDSHGNLYTDNTNTGLVIRVPVKPDGSAGNAAVVASGCANLHGADGITLDSKGNIYVAVNIQNRVIRIRPEGTIETIASGADGLDDPSGVALGSARGEPNELYIVSYALFTANGSKEPSLMKLDVGVAGAPLTNHLAPLHPAK